MTLVESLSGVRGIFGSELTETIVKNYATAYNSLIGSKKKIVVGYDTRQSNQIIKEWIANSTDFTILDVGVLPAPGVAFCVKHFGSDGGIIITASHNEPEYNGFKFLSSDGSIVDEKTSKKLMGKKDIEEKKAKTIDASKEALDAYLKHLLSFITKDDVKKMKKMKIKLLLDPNGGASSLVLPSLLKSLKLDYVLLNSKPGVFKRKIEPNIKTLEYLIPIINAEGCDFGAGFDCDSDRIEFVLPDSGFANAHGHMINGNYVLALAIESMFMEKLSNVVVNTATSNLVKDVVKKHGAKTYETDVGEINVVEEMKKRRSVIGGEGSNGGVIIDPIPMRDGILTLILILRLIVRTGKRIEKILERYPRYYTTAIKINGEIDKNIIERFKGKVIKKGYCTKIVDGNSFIYFRKSLTEHNIARIIADSDNPKTTEQLILKATTKFL